MDEVDEVETELKSAHYNIPLSHSHTTTTTKTIFRAPLSADQKIINITSHDQRPQHDTRRDVKRKNQIHLQLCLQLQLEPSQSQSHCMSSSDGRNKSEELSGCPYLAALEEVRDYTKRADTAILHVVRSG